MKGMREVNITIEDVEQIANNIKKELNLRKGGWTLAEHDFAKDIEERISNVIDNEVKQLKFKLQPKKYPAAMWLEYNILDDTVKLQILSSAIEYMKSYNGRSKIDCIALAMGYTIGSDDNGNNVYYKE